MDSIALDEKKRDEADVRNRLKRKAEQGRTNLVEQMLRQPEIQRALLRQSLESGISISCLLVGIMTVVQSLKKAFSVDWQLDLALGCILIVAFLIYIYWKLDQH